MKKFLASLVYTFVFVTFAATAQAAPISSWGYNLNMDFVNSDGGLSDTFTWQTTTNGLFGDRVATGNITGAESSLSGTVTKNTVLGFESYTGNTISTPLKFEKTGFTELESASGTVRFAFDFFPDGNKDLAQTLSFDVNFNVDPNSYHSLTFEAPSMGFYYDGYNYVWSLETWTTILSTAPNFSLTFTATEGSAPTATPEPATMLLMGAGLASLGAIRRRRAGK